MRNGKVNGELKMIIIVAKNFIQEGRSSDFIALANSFMD